MKEHKRVTHSECVTNFHWGRDPKRQGDYEIPLTERQVIRVYRLDTVSYDWILEAEHWRCSLREVLTLAKNKTRTDKITRRVQDDQGRDELITV